MEKIFSPRKKYRRDLEFLEQFFFNQLCKKRTHFLDSQEKSHEVTWSSPCLEKFIDLVKKAKMGENIYQKNSRFRSGKAKYVFERSGRCEKRNGKLPKRVLIFSPWEKK